MIIVHRILLFVFAAVFLALCPALVTHTLGILDTGIVKVRSEPGGASVTIDGRPLNRPTPLTISQLTPGDYEISLTAAGFRPWTRTVTVKEATATDLDEVLLVPAEVDVRVLGDARFDRLITIEHLPLVLLGKGERASDWRVFDLNNESLRNMIPDDSPFAKSRIEKVFTSAASNQAILRVKHEGKVHHLGMMLGSDPQSVWDLSANFPNSPERMFWDAAFPRLVFTYDDGNVSRINLANGNADPEFGKDWRGIGFFNKRVFRMDANYLIRSTDYDKSAEKTIFDDPTTAGEIFGNGNGFSIFPLDADTIMFLSEDGRLCQSGLPNVLAESGVRSIRSDPKSKRTIVWTAHKLGFLKGRTESEAENETERFKMGRQVSWVFEKGRDITDAWFVVNGSQAVVLDGDKLYLTELLTGVQAEPRELAKTLKSQPIRFFPERGLVYALDPKGRPVSIRVAPPAPSNTKFPERP